MSIEEAKKYVNEMDILYTDTWVDMEFFNNPAYAKQKEETMAKIKEKCKLASSVVEDFIVKYWK